MVKMVSPLLVVCLLSVLSCSSKSGDSNELVPPQDPTPSEETNWNENIQVAALMYHYFNTDKDIRNNAFDGIYPREFESDLSYFQQQGIQTITCSQLQSYLLGEINLPKQCVLLTIDDGHYSVYEHVFPLLPKYDAYVNLSIIGDYATNLSEKRSHDAPRLNWMNWDEIRAISQSKYVDIGSHSYFFHDRDHGRYGVKRNEGEPDYAYKNALNEDLYLNSAYISRYCGYEPVFFAYPFSAVQFDYVDYMLSAYSFKVLLAGNSKSISETCANVVSSGAAKRDPGVMLRRFSRYSGDNIEELVQSIFSNAVNAYTNRGLG